MNKIALGYTYVKTVFLTDGTWGYEIKGQDGISKYESGFPSEKEAFQAGVMFLLQTATEKLKTASEEYRRMGRILKSYQEMQSVFCSLGQ